MRQFGYMQVIPRELSVYVPSVMPHRDVDAMYKDFFNHLVSAKARGIVALSEWSYALEQIQWSFRLSHLYMTPNVKGESLRSAHQEILEEEHIMADHVVVSRILRERIQSEQTFHKALLEGPLQISFYLTHKIALQYRRQQRNMGFDIHSSIIFILGIICSIIIYNLLF